MARPKKAVAAIDNKVSRRTKSELEQRKAAEESLLSKERIFERATVRENPSSHKEYLRVKKLLDMKMRKMIQFDSMNPLKKCGIKGFWSICCCQRSLFFCVQV